MAHGDGETPALFKRTDLVPRPGLPTGRVIVPSDVDPAGPAFFEWELRGESWSDEHPHDEYVFVLEGSLRICAGGHEVSAAQGDLVRVPAGSRGAYAAQSFARLLSVYGPRPAGHHDSRGNLMQLDPACAGTGVGTVGGGDRLDQNRS